MTIEVITAELIEDSWECWLEISQPGETYLLPATAPGALPEADLQSHFDANETDLFALAQNKTIAPDELYDRITRRILKAFALVVLDEVNLLRGQHGLAARTGEQLRAAVKNKLKA